MKVLNNLMRNTHSEREENYLKKMIEFRWHGRGGQGAWTASELLARTALDEGKYIQSFPEFGPERMGAPVTAFTRISTEPIRLHCAIYDPDVVVVLDNTLLKTVPVTAGINRDDDVIIINSTEEPASLKRKPQSNKRQSLDGSSNGNCPENFGCTNNKHGIAWLRC